jgi:hypothetical protein
MRKKAAPFQYLLDCSLMSLEDFELARLDRAANLRRQLRDIAEEWIDAEVEARISHWVRENRLQPSKRVSDPRQPAVDLPPILCVRPATDGLCATDSVFSENSHSQLADHRHAVLAQRLPPPVQIVTGRRASDKSRPLAVVCCSCHQRSSRFEQVCKAREQCANRPHPGLAMR